MKWLKSPFIGAAYMREQKGRDESDDLSLVRSLNNATCVLGVKNRIKPPPEAAAPQKPWLDLAHCSVRDAAVELFSIKKGRFFFF